MHCQSCVTALTPAAPATFRFHIGMLIAREWHQTAGAWCRSCLRREYWRHQARNATLGWWGYQSFFATWLFLFTNTWAYVKACRALPATGGLPALNARSAPRAG
jgi:hypothetical protein